MLISEGALLDEVPAEGDALKINGSAMVALASSKEEVLAQLKKDVYGENEIWDFSKASVRELGKGECYLHLIRFRFILSSVLSVSHYK